MMNDNVELKLRHTQYQQQHNNIKKEKKQCERISVRYLYGRSGLVEAGSRACAVSTL